MASRVWLLVEWVEESNVLPSYGVVHVDILAYNKTDLQPGKLIFLRIRHENPRAAKILQISECKTYVKKQRKILRCQNRFKRVLQLCMLSIKKIKSENSFNARQQSSHSPLPRVGVAQNGHSDSDSDSGVTFKVKRRKTSNSRYSTPECTNIRSIISSTSISSTSAQENIRLYFDQETQTEETFFPPPVYKIEEFTALLKNHYKIFQYEANVKSSGSTAMSESEHNDEVPLGYGNAQVPANHMDSRSCACGTWQSLQAMFSRRNINTITRTEEENLHRNWHQFRQARKCRHQDTELVNSSDESTLL